MHKGKRIFNPLFLLVILPNIGKQPRLGITVSKKVSKRAVVRNRIKRQVREYFRYHQHRWPNYDFVLIANPAAAKSDNASLVSALNLIWIKAQKQITE